MCCDPAFPVYLPGRIKYENIIGYFDCILSASSACGKFFLNREHVYKLGWCGTQVLYIPELGNEFWLMTTKSNLIASDKYRNTYDVVLKPIEDNFEVFRAIEKYKKTKL